MRLSCRGPPLSLTPHLPPPTIPPILPPGAIASDLGVSAGCRPLRQPYRRPRLGRGSPAFHPALLSPSTSPITEYFATTRPPALQPIIDAGPIGPWAWPSPARASCTVRRAAAAGWCGSTPTAAPRPWPTSWSGVYHNQPRDLVVDSRDRIWFCDPHGDLAGGNESPDP